MPTMVRQGRSHQRSERGGGLLTLHHAEVLWSSQRPQARPLEKREGLYPRDTGPSQAGAMTTLNTDCSEVRTAGRWLHKGAWLRG